MFRSPSLGGLGTVGARARGRIEVVIALVAMILLAIAFRMFVPMDSAFVAEWVAYLRDHTNNGLAFAVVPALFVIAELAMLPVIVMIGITALAFEPSTAFVHALVGCALAALAGQLLGRSMGAQALDSFQGRGLDRVRKLGSKHGIWAVALARLLPIAPFAIVSLMFGALRFRARDVVIGSALGMAPVVAAAIWVADLWQ